MVVGWPRRLMTARRGFGPIDLQEGMMTQASSDDLDAIIIGAGVGGV